MNDNEMSELVAELARTFNLNEAIKQDLQEAVSFSISNDKKNGRVMTVEGVRADKTKFKHEVFGKARG